MEKNYAPSAKEKKVSTKSEMKVATPVETPKAEVKVEDKKIETNKVEKKMEVKKISKDKAVANGFSLPVSTKHSVAISRLIMRTSPDKAIETLELVLQKKLAVPMRNLEVPHRKRSLMPSNAGGGGRFPRNAAKEFINLLKQLKANCDVNEIENPVITLAVSNLASRPFRREGKRAKRTHVHLEAKDKTKLNLKKK